MNPKYMKKSNKKVKKKDKNERFSLQFLNDLYSCNAFIYNLTSWTSN